MKNPASLQDHHTLRNSRCHMLSTATSPNTCNSQPPTAQLKQLWSPDLKRSCHLHAMNITTGHASLSMRLANLFLLNQESLQRCIEGNTTSRTQSPPGGRSVSCFIIAVSFSPSMGLGIISAILNQVFWETYFVISCVWFNALTLRDVEKGQPCVLLEMF